MITFCIVFSYNVLLTFDHHPGETFNYNDIIFIWIFTIFSTCVVLRCILLLLYRRIWLNIQLIFFRTLITLITRWQEEEWVVQTECDKKPLLLNSLLLVSMHKGRRLISEDNFVIVVRNSNDRDYWGNPTTRWWNCWGNESIEDETHISGDGYRPTLRVKHTCGRNLMCSLDRNWWYHRDPSRMRECYSEDTYTRYRNRVR